MTSLPMKRSLSSRLDYPFFGGNLTPHGYKIDPQKVQAITEMKTPQTFKISKATLV